MACGTVFDAFRVATEYLPNEIYRRSHFRSALLNVTPTGAFPKNSGTSASILTIEPNELGTENTGGTEITQSAGATGQVQDGCENTWTDVNIGFTETTYTPRKWGFRGPIFCKDEQYFHHAPDEFINGYIDEMSKAVETDFESWIFYHYARLVPIYVASSTGFNALGSVSSSLTASAASSELTQDMLDRLAMNLIYERATPDAADGNGWVSFGDGGPLFTLLVGAEASQKILKNNTDLRQDLRDSNPSSLLNRLGATTALKNFRHLPWILPFRFSHDGSKYVIVPRFASSAATKGYKSAVNPNYISTTTAPYEAALVLSPYVMTREAVMPDSSVGGVSWDPSSYMGEWKWVTGTDAVSQTAGDGCLDPLHKKGRHFAEFQVAPRPGRNPRAGAIIFYKRCTGSLTTVTCS